MIQELPKQPLNTSTVVIRAMSTSPFFNLFMTHLLSVFLEYSVSAVLLPARKKYIRYGLRRFTEIMDIEPDITDSPDAVDLQFDHSSISFGNVWFRYHASPDWVLRGIDLTVPFGEKIAIVGEPGAGKSTLVALLSVLPNQVRPTGGCLKGDCQPGGPPTQPPGRTLRKEKLR
jgi:ABC-type multidrug transport system fused ATPase/permease subunit